LFVPRPSVSVPHHIDAGSETYAAGDRLVFSPSLQYRRGYRSGASAFDSKRKVFMQVSLGKYLLVALSMAGVATVTASSSTAESPPIIAAIPAPGSTVSVVEVEAAAPTRAALGLTADDRFHNFYFTRGAYSGWRRSWSIDAPDADRWIASVMNRLTFIDTSPNENYVALNDPRLRQFPFLYILEVGAMQMTEPEVSGLRDYLLRGGFLMVDDFWGSQEWYNWEREIGRVLPEYEIVEIPLTHEIFSTMYLVDEIVQVPSVGNARRGVTSERDGIIPRVLGIFDENDRLMVVINWNTDLGDAWEWAEAPYYPVEFSSYAYRVAANTFMYAMTH
jgi:hypothetical protein